MFAPMARAVGRNLVVVDVGCRWGFAEAWSALGPHVTIIGFDPDGKECERLRKAYSGQMNVQFVPLALGPSSGMVSLFQAADPACSSLYEPDATWTEALPGLACAKLVGKSTVNVVTMDSWAASAGIQEVDFIKLDTQGSELGVLQGAKRVITSVRALEVEVEFNPIYRGQPLFGDVDAFLRKRGFVLWRLKNLAHYTRSTSEANVRLEDRYFFDSKIVDMDTPGGQLFWGHAYYVRREMTAPKLSDDWKGHLRDSCILWALGFDDLRQNLLNGVREHAPPDIVRLVR
ncbi:MAG: FkbM family methyltransferase [Deltaproteobacteria bacterium]|nr:FkbM family methyltransferase [Deltaproteobacteria bacterium]